MEAGEEGGDLDVGDLDQERLGEHTQLLELGVGRAVGGFHDQLRQGLGVVDLAPEGDLRRDRRLVAVALRDDLLRGLLAVPEGGGAHLFL